MRGNGGWHTDSSDLEDARCTGRMDKDTVVMGFSVPGLVLELPTTWRWLTQVTCRAMGPPTLIF